MSRMGWHYGPCKPSNGGLIILVIAAVGIGGIGELAKHAKGAEQAINDILIGLGVIAGTAAIIALLVIVLAIRAVKPRSIHTYTKIREGVTMEIPKTDEASKAAFKAWLKLDPATQCSKEWDFLTNLNDDNRGLAQARLEGKVIES